MLNPINVGTSLITEMFTLGRKLTAGEKAIIQQVFKDAIDPEIVRINKSYIVGLFAKGNAMSPWGTSHFPSDDYKPDFSVESPSDKKWFVHEMAHVWQYQNGASVAGKGIAISCLGGYGKGSPAYNYDVSVTNKPFRKYNIEQQASIIADYYGATFLGLQLPQAQLAFVQNILRPFLTNPKDKGLSPTIEWTDDASTYKFDN